MNDEKFEGIIARVRNRRKWSDRGFIGGLLTGILIAAVSIALANSSPTIVETQIVSPNVDVIELASELAQRLPEPRVTIENPPDRLSAPEDAAGSDVTSAFETETRESLFYLTEAAPTNSDWEWFAGLVADRVATHSVSPASVDLGSIAVELESEWYLPLSALVERLQGVGFQADCPGECLSRDGLQIELGGAG